ncbi:MAG: peptide deformylase [Myxococcales bacterium]|nr:peptide deformylase [Myxococcales bacterium]
MILKVAQVGHPVLRERSREVTPEELASGAVQQFMDDLLETMDEYDGVGLAAPQVHVPLRIVALQISGDRGVEFLINPRITVLADTTRKTWEGCLSVEGFRGLVIRPDHVRVEALDRDGTEKVLEVKGHGAVVVQHECDHLDGVLYIDRLEPRSLVTTQNFRRYGPPEEYADEEADVDDEGLDDLDDD